MTPPPYEDVKQQTIEPTNIPITIFNFYDKMREIMFSAVDSLSSINSICIIWSCNKHVKRFAFINDIGDI